MIQLRVKLINPDIMRSFQRRFPGVVDQSLEETASYGKGLIMRSTAKGATGAAQASWLAVKAGNFFWRIINAQLYVKFLETGTGLFGPRHKRITSKSGGPLHWISLSKTFSRGKRKGETVYKSRMGSKKGGFKETGIYVMSTKGMPAQPMLAPNKEEIRRDLILRMRRFIRQLWSAATESEANSL